MNSKWIPPLAIALITILAGLLTLELGVRIIEPKKVLREDFERPHAVFHHRFVPNSSGNYKAHEFNTTYTINAFGLRDRDLARQKPAGTKRLLLLGDSFTEGNGVEANQAFPAQLQALVDKAGLPSRWEVINAGEGSYSPILQYLLLEKQLLELEPDFVLLNLDMSDFFDDIQYSQLATFSAGGAPTAVRPEPERKPGPFYVEAAYALKDFLKENTRAYNFVRRHVVYFFLEKPNASGDVRFDKYAMLRDGYVFGDGRDFALTFGYLERIRDLLAARGVPLWIAVYPYGHQVSPREWHHGRVFWSFEQNRVYSTEAQKQVERLAKERRIPTINMTEDFLERSKSEFPLYFPYDGHFTPAGHAVAAQSLMRALQSYLQAAK